LQAPPPAPANGQPVVAAPAEVWHLRFRDARGQWYTRRATTNQILHGLREHCWPAGVEAARGSNRHYRSLEVYPEFRATGAAAGGSSDQLGQSQSTPVPVQAALTSLRHWQVLLSTGFGVGLLAAAALCRLLMVL
jgi:hypothetical protein